MITSEEMKDLEGALCTGMSPEFDVPLRSEYSDNLERARVAWQRRINAEKMCGLCPVMIACASWAVKNNDRGVIRAGVLLSRIENFKSLELMLAS